MKRTRSFKPVALALGVGLLGTGVAAGASRSAPRDAASKPLRLAEATAIVEVNATDGDAGIQLFLDGEPWKTMTVSGPRGRQVGRLLAISTSGRLAAQGLTELFMESSEPPFGELPLNKFMRRFPEGRYTFDGITIDGRPIVGSARLSHDIPNGPEILAPSDGGTVDRSDAVLSWDPGAQPAGVDIVAYRAIVERQGKLRVFSADLPATVTSLTVSPEFLESGREYLFELQALEASGNITFSQIFFTIQ